MPLFRSRAAGLSGVLGTLAELICAALSTAGPAYAATPTVLYASPSGSGNTCSLSAPCSLDGAKSKVAGLAPGMAAGIDVYLRGGTYRLSQAFALGPSDSGRNGF
ncbi:hypothetical protein [Streptomyces torulosus]|uniref:hypothetical protein n=1 Tax=Streptomyces torulosus TaxID=68276 RepID=UPI0006EB93F4|nr:hypothetical protein [Streptomyces torulosus]